MNPKALAFVLITGTPVLAFADDPGTMPCEDFCMVNVQVSAPTSDTTACVPKVPHQIDVTHSAVDPAIIEWVLPPGYRFYTSVKRGIHFRSTHHHLHHYGLRGTHYAWGVDKGATSVSAPYDVNIIRLSDKKACLAVDPVVVNLD